jgi:ribonuclease HII
VPTWRHEEAARAGGFEFIAGIDEAGRGALAGPVVAAAVILPGPGRRRRKQPYQDSKLLSPERRDELARIVREESLAWAVGVATSEEVDRFNVLRATHLAAARALDALDPPPDFLLTDALKLSWRNLPCSAVIDGDARSYTIAAASILAKTHRDALMEALSSTHPGYDFAANKGYGAPLHLAALATLGPCPAHRRTFKPVAQPRLL